MYRILLCSNDTKTGDWWIKFMTPFWDECARSTVTDMPDLKDYLKPYGATFLHSSEFDVAGAYLEFKSEEDAIVFKLRYGV